MGKSRVQPYRKRKITGSVKPRLKLKDFERKIRIRPIVMDDFQRIVEIGVRCFPGMKPWLREHVESQIATFPEGQLGVEYDGKLVASSSSVIVDFSRYADWHDWRAIADNGFIRNHDPKGDTLYGIEIMVDPQFQGMRLARRLYNARKELAVARNVQRIILGGRIPGYGSHADKLSPQDYVEAVMNREIFDPVLTAQLANQFAIKGIIPGYFPSDDASRGYATYLEWTNLAHVPQTRRQLKAVAHVRLAVVQYQMRTIESFDDFKRQVEFFVDAAADHSADLLLFPELFTLQLLSLDKPARPGLSARKVAKYTPRYLKLFTRLAIRYHVNIVGGSAFTLEDDGLYNVAYLFRRDGTIERQYKLHITPNERKWWGVLPGRKLDVFETDCGPLAINVCYDVEFPELGRAAANKGARLLLVPFNTDERHGYLRVRHCAQARAIENHMFVAISGCAGNLPMVENADIHYAQSAIFTPSDFPFSRDAVAAECAPNIETVVLHDLDLELLPRHRAAGTTQNWNDRRTDLYSIHFTDGDETIRI